MKSYERSLDKEDLIRAALFLWMVFFLAARSAREIAFNTGSLVFSFFAFLTAISSPPNITLLTLVFIREPLKALLAVLVTGMRIV